MRPIRRVALVLAGVLFLGGQARAPAWFGVAPPPGLTDPPELVQARGAPPLILPSGDRLDPDFSGAAMMRSVRTVVGFSDQMEKEGAPLWGRISGFPSQARTADWVAARFKAAGVSDVQVQSFNASADMWWPTSWEVRVVADPAFGAGSRDIVLRSAVPVAQSAIAGGKLTAPLVYAGEAGAPVSVDVRGKIAIQHSRPTTGAYSDRTAIRESGQALMRAGAVSVFNWVEQSGNMHVFDFGGCGGPCFNIGAADGRFLRDVLHKSAGRPVMAKLSLTAGPKSGLTARNVIGLVPGDSPEAIIVNAHDDSWFDGAGDNADGVAVLIALARHYARPANRPARTLIFVASAGHHSTGLNGPANLVRMNGPLVSKAVLVLNLEHVAQYQARTDPWRVDPTEEPKSFGISNSAAFLVETARKGVERYGYRLTTPFVNTVPGDLGGYAPLGVARVQAIHSGPLYHTSGDVVGTISEPGLERAARFYAGFIDAVAAAPVDQINPPSAPAR